MSVFRAGWYVIYTKPRHEKKVYTRLAELNINCFLPNRKVLRVWHDRKKYVDEPLFPSYVFVYLDYLHDYYIGLETEGALYYVRCGKEIAKVPEAVIKNIMLITGQADDLEISDAPFHPGQKLVISAGALTGLSCEVVEFKNKRKLLVRVDLLKRNILLKMPVEQLMELGSA